MSVPALPSALRGIQSPCGEPASVQATPGANLIVGATSTGASGTMDQSSAAETAANALQRALDAATSHDDNTGSMDAYGHVKPVPKRPNAGGAAAAAGGGKRARITPQSQDEREIEQRITIVLGDTIHVL